MILGIHNILAPFQLSNSIRDLKKKHIDIGYSIVQANFLYFLQFKYTKSILSEYF